MTNQEIQDQIDAYKREIAMLAYAPFGVNASAQKRRYEKEIDALEKQLVEVA